MITYSTLRSFLVDGNLIAIQAIHWHPYSLQMMDCHRNYGENTEDAIYEVVDVVVQEFEGRLVVEYIAVLNYPAHD